MPSPQLWNALRVPWPPVPVKTESKISIPDVVFGNVRLSRGEFHRVIFLCAACIPHVSGRVFCFSSVSVFHMCACFFDELAVGFANSQGEEWRIERMVSRKPREECTREGDIISSHWTTYFSSAFVPFVCARFLLVVSAFVVSSSSDASSTS